LEILKFKVSILEMNLTNNLHKIEVLTIEYENEINAWRARQV